MNCIHIAISTVLITASSSAALAGIEYDVFDDFDDWSSAVAGEFTTIDFTGFPDLTVITDQYEDQGLIFSEGDEFVVGPDPIAFPQDGWGLRVSNTVTLDFAQPMSTIALHFPGNVVIELYQDDELLLITDEFGQSGFDNFAGIVGNTSFDRAVLYDPSDSLLFIDNIYFGPPIPAPGALPLLGLALLAHRRRRRR